jgi:uncharacterized membrane protein
MRSHSEALVVSHHDIAAIRQQLFRRWIPSCFALARKLFAVWVAGSVGLYLLVVYLHPDWKHASAGAGVLALMSVMVGVPFTIYVAKHAWLDYRIARRLEDMAQRLRAGKDVRVGEAPQ